MNDPKGILLFHGDPGVGKTYLCSAMMEWALTHFNSYRYHNEKKLLSRLREGISNDIGDYSKELEYLIDDDLIFLDDVGSGINPGKSTYRDLEWRREIFFNFLDLRYNCKKPTIITSNFTHEQFKDIFSERISSRLFASENTIVTIFGEGLDKRAKGY